ncbi:MAG: S8 family serine peptidase [Candidatus Hodarchaeaceae archaeon]|nr:S8 family serine peptidase [Candidatus Hodarchaeaceae archaeon]
MGKKGPRKFIAWIVIATIFLAFVPAPASAPSEEVRVIIVFRGRPDAALIAGVGGEVIATYSIIPGLAARVPAEALEGLRGNPAVAYVELDKVVRALEQQVPWGVDRIGAPSAWPISTGAGVKVAILDTGIQPDHPDLAANVKGGISLVGDENSADPARWNDGNGHGTHVAGIAAAVNDDVGVVGVAPAAWLYAVKVLADNGKGYVSDVVEGIDWSVQNGMQVINMSLGTTSDVPALKDACDEAYARGILLVAAAGNEGENGVSYPARYESVVAAAATDGHDEVPTWSSKGAEIELAAPGVGVYSTYRGSTYAWASGTSMAAPHVAGAAALVLARSPGLTNAQVRSILQQTAQDLGPAGRDNLYGYGLVRADKAIETTITVLRPNASGQYAEYSTVVGATEHWDAVDDVAPDEDSTYAATATLGHRDVFNLDDGGLPDVPISNVRVYARARKTTAAATKINLMIRTHDNDYVSEDMALTTSYANYYRDWAANPPTGKSWTASEVDALQAGVRSASSKSHRVTQVYVEVAHAVPRYGVEASISPSEKSGPPGEVLDYIVTVVNTGNVSDNYILTVSDNSGWGPSVQPTSLSVLAGENGVATLSVVVPENSAPYAEDNITVVASGTGVSDSTSCVARAAPVYGVEVSIAPENASAPPGGTLTYTVTVKNVGNVVDNYSLTAADNAGWGPSISPPSLEVPPGENGTATLTVVVPLGTPGSAEDNITLVAAGTGVSRSANCIARAAIVRGVMLSVSPENQGTLPGTTLEYAVLVTNLGNAEDNFSLEATDDLGWGPTLSDNYLTIPAGENVSVALTIAVPENAASGVEDSITIVATSLSDNAVSAAASCIARAENASVEFDLVTLHEVGLSVSARLTDGSKLVVKFYTYGGSYQGENVVWSGPTPDNVSFSTIVPHPENKAIEKVRLDLTYDNTENVISTLASFVVTRSALWGRILEIKSRWPFASLEERADLWSEILAIKGRWPFAPA